MEIVYENFKLIPSHGGRFDLIEKVSRKKKDTEEAYDDWNTLGYDMHFENALHLIAKLMVTKKKDKKQITIEEYIQAYKAERNKVANSLK